MLHCAIGVKPNPKMRGVATSDQTKVVVPVSEAGCAVAAASWTILFGSTVVINIDSDGDGVGVGSVALETRTLYLI